MIVSLAAFNVLLNYLGSAADLIEGNLLWNFPEYFYPMHYTTLLTPEHLVPTMFS